MSTGVSGQALLQRASFPSRPHVTPLVTLPVEASRMPWWGPGSPRGTPHRFPGRPRRTGSFSFHPIQYLVLPSFSTGWPDVPRKAPSPCSCSVGPLQPSLVSAPLAGRPSGGRQGGLTSVSRLWGRPGEVPTAACTSSACCHPQPHAGIPERPHGPPHTAACPRPGLC